jgi:histone deacetylase 6
MIRYVNTVIQVVGNMTIPLIPKDADELRAWYSKVCIVFRCGWHI